MGFNNLKEAYYQILRAYLNREVPPSGKMPHIGAVVRAIGGRACPIEFKVHALANTGFGTKEILDACRDGKVSSVVDAVRCLNDEDLCAAILIKDLDGASKMCVRNIFGFDAEELGSIMTEVVAETQEAIAVKVLETLEEGLKESPETVVFVFGLDEERFNDLLKYHPSFDGRVRQIQDEEGV